MKTELTSENVEQIFGECLASYKDELALKVEGIMLTASFDLDKLNKNGAAIIEMLEELPDEFKFGIGNGWSFLCACKDKHGNQWADLHLTMDKLVVLGIAIGCARYQMPRDMWHIFPGGMPYFAVCNEPFKMPKMSWDK